MKEAFSSKKVSSQSGVFVFIDDIIKELPKFGDCSSKYVMDYYFHILDDYKKGNLTISSREAHRNHTSFWNRRGRESLDYRAKRAFVFHPDIYTTLINEGYKRDLFNPDQQKMLDNLRIGNHDVSYCCYPDISAKTMELIVQHCEEHGGHRRRVEYWKVARVKGRVLPGSDDESEYNRTECLCFFVDFKVPFCDYANIDEMSDQFLYYSEIAYRNLFTHNNFYFSSFSTKIAFIQELNKLCRNQYSTDQEWDNFLNHLEKKFVPMADKFSSKFFKK